MGPEVDISCWWMWSIFKEKNDITKIRRVQVRRKWIPRC